MDQGQFYVTDLDLLDVHLSSVARRASSQPVYEPAL
jgi:hypothetical protein